MVFCSSHTPQLICIGHTALTTLVHDLFFIPISGSLYLMIEIFLLGARLPDRFDNWFSSENVQA